MRVPIELPAPTNNPLVIALRRPSARLSVTAHAAGRTAAVAVVAFQSVLWRELSSVGIFLALIVMIAVGTAFYFISLKGPDGKRWASRRGGR